MKRKSLKTLLAVACVVLALAAPAFTGAGAQAASSELIELSLALMMPSTHIRWKRSMAPWIKMLEERAKGKIKIVPYFAGSLAKGSEIFEAVSQGIADLGEVSTGHSPGRFRLAEFFQLPGLAIPDCEVGSRLHWDLIEKIPEFAAQYAETKAIMAYSYGGGAANLIMSRVPIHTLEDLHGKKLNIYGGPIGTNIAKALGFTPIHMNIPDVYLAVEKGVMDGVISHVSLLTSRKFGEIMKHVTYGVVFGGAPMVFVMNLAKWKGLPPDVQKAFDELGGMYGSGFFGKNFLLDEKDAWEGGKKEFGCEFYKLPSDELAKWNARLEDVQKDWVKRAEDKGLAGRKVMEEYKRFVKMQK